VAAAVDLSGDACFFAPSFFATRSVPLLAIGGSRDVYVPAPINVTYAYDHALPPKTRLILKGGSHLAFTDFDVPDDPNVTPTHPGDPLADTLQALGGGTACLPVPPPADDAPLPTASQHDLSTAWTRAFLDATLRGERAGLEALRADPDPRIDLSWE